MCKLLGANVLRHIIDINRRDDRMYVGLII